MKTTISFIGGLIVGIVLMFFYYQINTESKSIDSLIVDTSESFKGTTWKFEKIDWELYFTSEERVVLTLDTEGNKHRVFFDFIRMGDEFTLSMAEEDLFALTMIAAFGEINQMNGQILSANEMRINATKGPIKLIKIN